jgi:hypothetical protein
VAGIAVYAWASQLAPYAVPWSAPWHVERGSRASAAANAAIRFAVLAAIGAGWAWRSPASTESVSNLCSPPECIRGSGQPALPVPSATVPWTLPDLTWLWITVGGLALACAAVVLIPAARRHISRASGARLNEASDTESLGSWLDQGIAEILAERDPRRAILACYAVMERRLGSVGIQRSLEETAIEYARRLLERSGAPPKPVRALTELFHLAGYSSHVINESMRQSAIDSLFEISQAA